MESHKGCASRCWLPAIDPMEVRVLAAKYGEPMHRRFDIETDAYLRARRWRQSPDRRGEVIFAIRQPNGEILLHTKHRYETPIYRLPSGGIGHREAVEDALFREVAEETGQPVVLRRFLGILDCHFHLNGSSVSFVSYVFYLESLSGELQPGDPAEVAGYRTVPASKLTCVAQSLRNLQGKRRCWGYWRSLAHDLVHDALACNAHLN